VSSTQENPLLGCSHLSTCVWFTFLLVSKRKKTNAWHLDGMQALKTLYLLYQWHKIVDFDSLSSFPVHQCYNIGVKANNLFLRYPNIWGKQEIRITQGLDSPPILDFYNCPRMKVWQLSSQIFVLQQPKIVQFEGKKKDLIIFFSIYWWP